MEISKYFSTIIWQIHPPQNQRSSNHPAETVANWSTTMSCSYQVAMACNCTDPSTQRTARRKTCCNASDPCAEINYKRGYIEASPDSNLQEFFASSLHFSNSIKPIDPKALFPSQPFGTHIHHKIQKHRFHHNHMGAKRPQNSSQEPNQTTSPMCSKFLVIHAATPRSLHNSPSQFGTAIIHKEWRTFNVNLQMCSFKVPSQKPRNKASRTFNFGPC